MTILRRNGVFSNRLDMLRRSTPTRLSLEPLETRLLMTASSPIPAPVAGSIISGITPHTWTADVRGQYHTTTDLAAEWKGIYQQMLAGNLAGLTPIQRLEGNAEAVFENTGLNNLSAKAQARDREDAQREFDAMAASMSINQTTLGIDPNSPLTEHAYLMLEKTLQNNPDLLELGLQGHGLNDPPARRYRGYTNDFQNNVDGTTLFVGGGLDQNENAIAALFDDVILSHAPFPVVWEDGQLTQLNQNGDAEDNLLDSVVGLDDYMYSRVLTSADFSADPSTAPDNYVSPFQQLVAGSAIDLSAAPSGGVINGLLGPVSTTISGITPHTWVADADGRFHTTADLAAEWKGYYQQMLAGQAGSLTPIQRLEGNAEAVFENTGLSKLSAAEQAQDREDAQLEFDAMAAAITINQAKYGTDPTAPLTQATYLQLEKTLQSDATLLEMGMQGHGLNDPPSARYDGYTNDFQNNVDGRTRYIGGGLNNGKNALADFFDDNILSHTPFPVVWRNGKLQQLNQDGDAENTLARAVTALDASMVYRTFLATDFSSGHGHHHCASAAATSASASLQDLAPLLAAVAKK